MGQNASHVCNVNHTMKTLSFFTSACSIFLLIFTTMINVLFLVTLLKNKALLKNSLFYKMLLNIAVADLLTGLISDSASISFHIKEGMRHEISKGEVYLLHSSLFFINGASMLTMTLLCIDRVVALRKPIMYRKGLQFWKSSLLILSTWVLSAILIIPYFYWGYIKYLSIFSYLTVGITFISLVGAALIYNRYLKPFNGSSSPMSTALSMEQEIKPYIIADMNAAARKKNVNKKVELETRGLTIFDKYQKRFCVAKTHSVPSSSEDRVNKSFVIMLIVFLMSYLPAAVMTAYMNLCTVCNCNLIHALRDMTYIVILSSALWRPLNFMLRLKTLKKAAQEIWKQGKTSPPGVTNNKSNTSSFSHTGAGSFVSLQTKLSPAGSVSSLTKSSILGSFTTIPENCSIGSIDKSFRNLKTRSLQLDSISMPISLIERSKNTSLKYDCISSNPANLSPLSKSY